MPQTQLLNSGGRINCQIGVYTATVDPANPVGAGTQEDAVTIAGVKVGDVVLAVNKPTVTAAFAVTGARVSAANTIQVQSVATGAATPGSEVYTFVIAHLV